MNELAQYTLNKQVETLNDQVPTISIGTAVTASVITVTMLFAYEALPLILWLSYMFVVSAVRYYWMVKYKQEGVEQRGSRFWMNVFLIGSVFGGTGTGLLVFYFFDFGKLNYLILVLLTYTGYIAAGTSSNSSYMPAFFAFSIPATLLVILRLVLEFEDTFSTLIVIMIFYYLAMIGFARNANRSFLEGVKWSFERDALIKELRQQKETAENAMKAKSNFLASASHDLRQPLHALGLFHDALRYRISDPESLEIMDKISSSTQALNELLHAMLDISKLDASVIENEPKDVNLYECLEALHYEFSARAKEKDIEFNLDIPKDVYAYVDVVLFERVVRNLIDNAVKYTEKGSVDISVVDSPESDYLEMSIVDTGIGIPEDKMGEVFIEFNQLDNYERDKQKGLGLGLSIVKRLCQLMDIDMEFNSIVGEGTEVILDFPKGNKRQYTMDHSESDLSTVSKSTILIIEDNPQILDGMGMLLENFGFLALKALDADQAMALADAKSPDLIVADYRLPGDTDGLELIGAIRSRHTSQIPAILITGDTAPEQLRTTKDSDVKVLHKPVETDILQQAIETALKSTVE